MNRNSSWERANELYLAAGLHWLRLRLRSVAIQATSDGAPPQEEIDAAYQAWQATIDVEYLPPLESIARQFGLSDFEKHVLLMCAAMEFDLSVPELCEAAQVGTRRNYPTIALSMLAFDAPCWDILSPDRPLRRLRLIEIHHAGVTPVMTAALRADERIVNHIKGLDYLDERLAPLFVPFDVVDCPELPISQKTLIANIVTELQQASQANDGSLLPLIHLVGVDTVSKQLIAQLTARCFGHHLLRLPADTISRDFPDLELVLRLWEREQALTPTAIYVDAQDVDPLQIERAGSTLNRFLSRLQGLVFLDTADVRHMTGRECAFFEVCKPTLEEQVTLWSRELPQAADDGSSKSIEKSGSKSASIASELAGQFSLDAVRIRRIASRVLESPSPSPDHRETLLLRDAAWGECRKATRPRLDALAQRIDAKATWSDLVLPADELNSLRSIADQVRNRGHVYNELGFSARFNRGLGISVLFAGESGTGKTMAAEVIANELRLDLYRIDLSAVVNKYIGETEKNLRKLFDAADDGGVILLFDEADSLFGKRTDVKDAHDRYANLEVNYLLQRMEAYRGLAILATNLQGSMDGAFLRRLRFVINFPTPEPQQRSEMWRRAFPKEVPLDGIDFDRLSRLNLTGGNIHTIALNSVFASVQSGGALALPHILTAAKAEFRKLQKPLNAADFRWSPSAGGDA